MTEKSKVESWASKARFAHEIRSYIDIHRYRTDTSSQIKKLIRGSSIFKECVK